MNFRFFYESQKRKGSIEIYRSFVIPNLSNEMTLWWGEGLSHSMISKRHWIYLPRNKTTNLPEVLNFQN
jgi:hypothetical protein